jgi:hypothetical protein
VETELGLDEEFTKIIEAAMIAIARTNAATPYFMVLAFTGIFGRGYPWTELILEL